MNPTPSTAELLMEVTDSMVAVLEAVTGYRAQCEAKGFSPTAAEAMAMDLHRSLMIAGLDPTD